jgi:hypothetical protein
MADESEATKPIIRITRWSVAVSATGRGKKQSAETQHWTIYGVDTDGVERVYVEHASDEEHELWRISDPLWHEAQAAMIQRLLENPATRDTVLKINIKAAIDVGNLETAAELARHLSPKVLNQLTANKTESQGERD